MNQPLTVSCLCLILFFLVVFLLLGCFGYRKKSGVKFHFRNGFPYELVTESDRTYFVPIAGSIFMLFGSLILGCILLNTYEWPSSSLRIYGMIASLSYSLSFALMIALLVVPAKFVKAHTALASSFIALSALSAILSGFALLKLSLSEWPIVNVIAIILLVLGVSILALMLHPKFASWAHLDAKIEEDGSLSLSRPKFFILAFAEWIAFFFEVLSLILLLIALLIGQ